MAKKIDQMTRLRRLLLESRDAIFQSITDAGWDKVATEPALGQRVQLIRRIDKAITASTEESK